MKILLSPSEAKSSHSPINKPLKENLSFNSLFAIRLKAVKEYEDFLQNATTEKLSKLIGIKDEKEILEYRDLNILNAPLQKAILRYTGVGYKYLDFSSLETKAQEILLNSTIIFSNLFGPLLAKDSIPYYKLKQGENIGDFIPHKHYKEFSTTILNEFLEDELIVDLRAGFYDKFYKCKHKRVVLKFLKNGKVVSHYAKAYRGLIARELAIHNPQNEDEFSKIPFPNLHAKEIQSKKGVTLYVYEIME